jgi:hypothetical protein
MNPSDLLLTNQYQPSLESFQKDREQEELKDFLKSELHLSDKKFNNLAENAMLTSNLYMPKWIAGKEQLSLSNAIRPVIDDTAKNLSLRYRKQRISYISIDSRFRNAKRYPNSADYSIYLNHEFKHLQSISLASIEFRQAPTPINNTNDTFIWTTNYKGLEDIEDDCLITYEVKIPRAFYTLDVFVRVVENVLNSRMHMKEDLNCTFPNFRLSIDPNNGAIGFIQRMESLRIYCISTTAGSNCVEFWVENYGDAPNEIDCSDDCDYPFRPSKEKVPIILTGLDLFFNNIGGISVRYLEGIPFFPGTECNQYECVGYEENLDAGKCEPTGFFKYKLYLCDPCGNNVNACYTICKRLEGTTLRNYPNGHAEEANVGRALLFSIDTECGTFGNFLGLTNPGEEKYIHTNVNILTRTVENTIPWKIVGTGELSLATEEYILMRIETESKPIGTISGNLICAKGGTANMELENKKEDNFFFAKIIFSPEPPGDISVVSVGGNKFFYDGPLLTLSDLKVQFYAANGQILELKQNHSFTLEITELQEVLKDALVDSRTGNIADIGSNVETTNTI